METQIILEEEVLVFTTSVGSVRQVKELEPALNSFAGRGNWNFALDDSDRILRIVSNSVDPADAIRILGDNGFICREL